jgi:D-glycero-D-manno-heptose 1,7-bisphosphate phosphatase
VSRGRAAVFLDRDGVLVRDHGPLVQLQDAEIPDDVPVALARLRRAGYVLVGVSNQTVVARGLLTEDEARALQQRIDDTMVLRGGVPLDAFYLCPHHPEADVAAYRGACDCRKPAPGMLLRATAELSLDLRRSIMVGDRPSDVAAGRAAGCRTVWLHSGRHDDPPIRSATPIADARPDHVCTTLTEVAQWLGA